MATLRGHTHPGGGNDDDDESSKQSDVATSGGGDESGRCDSLWEDGVQLPSGGDGVSETRPCDEPASKKIRFAVPAPEDADLSRPPVRASEVRAKMHSLRRDLNFNQSVLLVMLDALCTPFKDVDTS